MTLTFKSLVNPSSRRPERQDGETFLAYRERRAANNVLPKVKLLWDSSRRPPRTVDINRQDRRAMIKQIGARQFKKLYKGAQA